MFFRWTRPKGGKDLAKNEPPKWPGSGAKTIPRPSMRLRYLHWGLISGGLCRRSSEFVPWGRVSQGKAPSVHPLESWDRMVPRMERTLPMLTKHQERCSFDLRRTPTWGTQLAKVELGFFNLRQVRSIHSYRSKTSRITEVDHTQTRLMGLPYMPPH